MGTPGVDRVILVRHAMPEIDPEVPSALWRLGPAGRAAARALRPRVPSSAYFVASTEPKAVQTLEEIAGHRDVATDPDFGEVRRPHAWLDGTAYRSLAHSYVDGLLPDGWESRSAVAERFGAALARHAPAANRTLVVGTHGLAVTVWLAAVTALDRSPGQFWAALRFPDLVEVEVDLRLAGSGGYAAKCTWTRSTGASGAPQ
jgi:broad specificity phosphatase PhoE